MIGKTISHYRILEELGRGGMGIVYKAEDTKLKRTAALKFLPSHLTKNETDKARFFQEAQTAAALNHPNVCTIYEIHDEGENPFIVMEYIEGKTLRKIAGEGLTLPLQDVTDYSIQIAEALKAAHGKGVVHRDIKSENIMVTKTGQVKVMDFGLAKLRGAVKITKTSTTIGTIAYMSPEHIEGKEVDARTDIFSFGVVLYEMLTDRLPFKGEYDSAMMYAIVNEEPEPIQKHRSDLSSEMLHVLNRALEKNPDERYQSVNDMLIDLKRLERDTTKIDREIKPALKANSDKGKAVGHKKYRQLIQIGSFVITVVLVGIVLLVILNNRAIDSLAILPFTYPADQSEIQYLSESIPDRILFKLQKLPNLKRVIPFSSVLQYYREDIPDILEAGRELGVKAVGIGRMSLINDNLEINIEIIDVKKNNLILKEPYTEKLANLAHIPSTIAQDITIKLGHRLSGDEQSRLLRPESQNSEAYQNYLMGRFHWNKRSPKGIQDAIEYFHRAIVQDSGFALAHAGLTDAYILLPHYSGIFLDDVWERAKNAARKALAFDPYSSEVHTAYSNILVNEWKWEEARKELDRAIELDSNNSNAHYFYGMLLIIIGDMEGAISKLKTALNLDPLSMVANRNLGLAYEFFNKYDKAIEHYEKAIEIAPDDPTTYLSLSGIYLNKMDVEKTLFNLQKYYKIMNLHQVDEIVKKTLPDGNFQMSLVPQFFSLMRSEVKRIRHPILSKPFYQSISYAIAGDADSLFFMLHKAIDLREFNVFINLRHPIMDPFRSDPRFREILKRTNLDRYYE